MGTVIDEIKLKSREVLGLLFTRTGLLLVLGAAFLGFGAYSGLASPLVFGWVLTFAAYDVYGFNYVDQYRGSQGYRIIQFMFQAALTGLIWFAGGWKAAVAANVMWITLSCDLLFKWALWERVTEWSWFLLSPAVGFCMVVLRKPAPVWLIVVQCLVGIVVAIYILLT